MGQWGTSLYFIVWTGRMGQWGTSLYFIVWTGRMGQWGTSLYFIVWTGRMGQWGTSLYFRKYHMDRVALDHTTSEFDDADWTSILQQSSSQ